jgi:cell division protein ZapB
MKWAVKTAMNQRRMDNPLYVWRAYERALYNERQMAAQTFIDQIAARVDRLLLRHEELHKTNALLLQQVHSLTQERDLLKSQCQAARQRLDDLINRLPRTEDTHPDR